MDRFIVTDEEFENKIKIENNATATIDNINIVREKDSDLNLDLLADPGKINKNLTQEIMDTDISDDELNDFNLNNNNAENNEPLFRENALNLENNNINIINSPLVQPVETKIQVFDSPLFENPDMGRSTNYFDLNLGGEKENQPDNIFDEEKMKTPNDFFNINFGNQEEPQINRNSPINYNQASPVPVVRNTEEEKNYQARQPVVEKKTQEEIYKEKRDILFKLKRLKKKGINVPRFTIDSDIEVMKEELESIERELAMDSSVQFYSNGLTFLCSLIEFGNDKMNFGLNFKHLTAHMEDQKQQFVPIFEELHEKYQDTPAMPPEVKLVATFGFCLFTYHLTNTQTQKSSPMSSMFSNVMGATQAKPEKPKTFSERMNDRMDKRTKPDEEPMDRNMSGPTGVEDILAEIQKEKEKYLNSDNVSESGGSGDSYSIISGSEIGTKKKVRRRKTKKPEFDLNL
jgi:hypothetical protein